MRRSIKSRITVSYILVVLISLIIAGLFFSMASRRYIERRTKQTLINEAGYIQEIYRENKDNGLDRLELLRMVYRLNQLGMESSCAIVVKNKGNFNVVYPKDTAKADMFKNEMLPHIENRLNKSLRQAFKVSAGNIEYIAAIYPIYLTDSQINIPLTFIVMYMRLEQINELNKGLVTVLLFSLVFGALMALILGVISTRSITKPIISLKKYVEKLAKRDFDAKIDINTKDELEELAVTTNKMAVELKEYDIAQKRFLQNASHELKTPLMSIQGYAEGIKDEVFENKDEALNIIVEESKRLKGIVEELIFLSKLETMEDFYDFKYESINDVIEKSIEKIGSISIRSGIRVNSMLYRDVRINIDRDKFTQALINIISNCIRYARSEVSIITSNDGEILKIEISDDGEGIKQEDMGRIFERFYKGRRGDTGLGMAITKVIIEKHGGSITASNKAGGGAVFAIMLNAQD
jgi:two-component system, OmpR family, sensor histidine kinase CssS